MKQENRILEIPVSKRIVDMIGGDLLVLIRQAVKTELENKTPPPIIYPGLPRFVTGLKSLAFVLNTSVSTVSRWKSKGLLDAVTFQDTNEKFMSFDVYGVLDVLRLSNQQGKYNQSKFNHKK